MKVTILVMTFAVFIILVGLYLYSDIYGNPTMQSTVAELLKVAIGGLIGVFGSMFAKK